MNQFINDCFIYIFVLICFNMIRYILLITTLYILDPPYLNTKNHTYENIPENKLMYIFSEIFTNKNILYFGNDRNPFFILLEYLKERGFLEIDIKKSKKKNSHVINNEIIVSKKFTRDLVS